MIPVEFKEFTKLFLRGSLNWTKDKIEFIDNAIDFLDAKQKLVVKAYIDELLSGKKEDELNEIWISCSPNYWIQEGKMTEFLTEIRRRLAAREQ